MRSPASTSFLYTPPEDTSGRLYPFCHALRNRFTREKLMVEETRAMKLHATVLNTIYAGKIYPSKRPAQAEGPAVKDAEKEHGSEGEHPEEGHLTGEPAGGDHEVAEHNGAGSNGGHPDRSMKKKGKRRKQAVQFDARDLLERYVDFEWARDVKVEKVAICEMGAKKILDENGEVVVDLSDESAVTRLAVVVRAAESGTLNSALPANLNTRGTAFASFTLSRTASIIIATRRKALVGRIDVDLAKLATTVVLSMAAVAQSLAGRSAPAPDYSLLGSDADAEGEEDIEADYEDAVQPSGAVIQADKSDEDAQMESEEEEENGDSEAASDVVQSVKKTGGRRARDRDNDAAMDDASEGETGSAEDEDESDKSSSDAESAAAGEWEGGSDGGEDASVEVANRNNCIFCHQDEEHDPSEEFEEYMACAVCGDNSHRQCARDASSLSSDDDAARWRCPTCVENALEPDDDDDDDDEDHRENDLQSLQRRSSTSKLTRDLLPAQRGTSRAGSHSVFNTLILEDDPLDGSRSLRKRKTSSAELDRPSADSRKRQRTQDTSSVRSGPSRSPARSDKRSAPPITEEDVVVMDDVASTSTRKSRPARARRPTVDARHATVLKRSAQNIVLKFQLDPRRLRTILATQPPKKRKRPPRPSARMAAEEEPDSARPMPSFTQYSTPFYSFHQSENDELKSKPYGGILSETEANTEKTLPLAADRARFNDARQKAEDEWKQKTASEGENENPRRSQKVSGPPSKIKCVHFGGYEIETWYAAPYPEEYSRNRVLYICEFCLKYMNSDYVAWRHKLKCPAKHPPGDEIYRDKSISIFEVDGRKNPVYCQNLCLLAKLFLGSKTLYYDVEPFLFYVMTEYDELGCHFVGYFSKEKRPSSQNNVSCILTLPTHQRKGYGNLLISFSYLLTRVEGKTGSPEKPLSDMGLVSYRNYWKLVLSYELLKQKEALSIIDLSDRTGMTADDIIAALEALRALVRDPVTKTYALRLDHAYFKHCIETWEAKKYVTLNPDALVWTPYIMGRSNLAHYDRAPPLPTIAPREGDEADEQVASEEG
ncbi:MAG: hypothetical protein Q9210_007324, partial [Variospora velana]